MPQLDGARVSVKRDYQLGLEPAGLDANQMEQVFLNLINNAVQAMPDGGTLHCGLRIADLGLRIEGTESETPEAAFRIPHSAIEYTLSDTGVGIPPDVIDKIFDPFFSTKTHGTGLGLASVKKIIEAHQGTISVDAEAGAGATFTIRLPTATETMNAE
jgi:signal transduction histidine kinase